MRIAKGSVVTIKQFFFFKFCFGFFACIQVKNSFISLLIEVQNRQKEHRELLRKKKKIRHTTTTGPNGQRTASTHIPGTVSHVVTLVEEDMHYFDESV